MMKADIPNGILFKAIINIEIKIVAVKETFILATPFAIPTDTAQNIKTMSNGSFIAALNLTIERAPTIPKERTRFPLMTIMTAVVIRQIKIKEILKLF